MKKVSIILWMFLYTIPAVANCGLTLTASNISINWDLNFSTQAIQFTLQKANAPACDFWIGFTKGGGANATNRRMTAGSSILPYQLYKDNGYSKVLKDSNDAPINNSDEVLNGSFPAGTNITQTLLYFFDIPANGSTTPILIKDGSYTDSFTMNVYEGSDPTVASPSPVTSSGITVTAVVPKMIKMALVSSGGPFDSSAISKSINFGTLSPGQSSSFDLRVRTNAGFTVSFSSACRDETCGKSNSCRSSLYALCEWSIAQFKQ